MTAVACAPDQISVLESEEETSQPSEINLLLENPERIGFAEVSEYAFQESCHSCHNSNDSAGGIDLTSYEPDDVGRAT